MPVRRLDPTAVPRPAPSNLARGGPRPGSHDHTVQELLKLPGFCFTRNNNVFNSRDGANLATILGAQFELGGSHRRPSPASNQRQVCVRVANVIEACCDEWLDDWQDEALTSDFWAEAAERLRCYDKHWAAVNPTPVQVNTICMAYTGHWDENGRGSPPDDDEASWGFELSKLTWGTVKAQIDPDLFAKPWEYERACKSLVFLSSSSLRSAYTNTTISTENAARDFFEYVNETETNFGPIQRAVGARNNNRNHRRSGRSLVAPCEAPGGSRPRAVALDVPHQFILRDDGDPVIVCGPRRINNEKVEGNIASGVKATIDRSDPKRLLVTFSGLVFEGRDRGEENQEFQHGDEGKDVHSIQGDRQFSEDTETYSLYEEVL